jgi:hypothetical protein
MLVAEVILWAAAVYLLPGFLIGVPFIWRGVQRVDSAAACASWGFRLIILPGCVALWPLLVRRWNQGKNEDTP